MVWNDGAVVEASNFSLDRPYIMQRIHTLGHRVYNISRHILLLREASMRYFGFASLCRAEDAERIIVKLLELSRVTMSLSVPVVMRLDVDGRLSFEVEMPAYNGGVLHNAKRFTGVAIAASRPFHFVESSVTIAIDNMIDSTTSQYGGDLAIWVDGNGMVISRPWRPLFAVHGSVVYTPEAFDSVEYFSVVEAVAKCGLELQVRDIPFDVLQRMEEVFVVDIMSVSSVANIKKSRLLSVVTSRIVSKMEPKG
jgi:hypothetical protein